MNVPLAPKPAALLLAAAFLSSAMWSPNACADGASAARYMFANMERANRTYNVNAAEVVVEATPVRGMYAIYTRQGRLVSLTNEAGTVTGDGHGLDVMDPGGAAPRRMTAAEQADYRAEVMANIDFDKLIKVTYGNGGGRKLVMFSALDCGYCRKLEDTLAKNARTLDSTFYVMPGSLRGVRNGGLAALQSVSRIWCAPNNGAAWKNFWSKQAVPPERTCGITPATVEHDELLFKHVLGAAGIPINGVPTVLNENGDRVSYSYDLNAASAAAAFGPDVRPQAVAAKPAFWIVSPGEAGAQQQIALAQAPQRAQPPQQQSGKISGKDLLKKLFK
jgi:hypothetical protein